MRKTSNGTSMRRSGFILVLVALLLPVLFGILALVIDMGFAMSTSRLMQSAADAAAVEGLRHQDDLADVDRRERARQRVLQMFDDNLEPADPGYDPASDPAYTDSFPFGAGPIIRLGAGKTDLNAQQTIDTSTHGTDPGLDSSGTDTGGVYNPYLQLNLANLAHGDMIAGAYNPAQPHTEGDNYVRNDLAAGSGAFLVRLRRTRNANGLDSVAGVSSTGPTLPLMLGRGSMMKAADPAAGYSPRHHGVSLRTVGIAVAERAMTAGPTIPANMYGAGAPAATIYGTAPFEFEQTWWNSLPVGANEVLDWDPSGDLLWDSDPGPGVSMIIVGRTIRTWVVSDGGDGTEPLDAGDTTLSVESSTGVPATPFLVRIDSELLLVTNVAGLDWTVIRGERGTLDAGHARRSPIHLFANVNLGDSWTFMPRPQTVNGCGNMAANLNSSEVIIPVYEDDFGLGARVTGFGSATIQPVAPFNDQLQIVKQAGRVAPVNVSAVLSQPLSPPTWTTANIELLFDRRQTLNQAILAPAGARAYSR